MPTAPVVDVGDPSLDALDNPAWLALTSRHERFAEVVGCARRYPLDVSPFGAVDELDDRSWEDQRRLVGAGGTAVLFRAGAIAAPPGWVELQRGVGHQMLATALVDQPDVEAQLLQERDVDDVLELIAVARPGPFARRTIQLGDYHGVFDDGRLVAMAGERLTLPGFTEVSAVCTHPDARGRGLAGALTYRVARRILDRGDLPFLHVADGNPAGGLYERLGFTARTTVSFAALQAPPD